MGLRWRHSVLRAAALTEPSSNLPVLVSALAGGSLSSTPFSSTGYLVPRFLASQFSAGASSEFIGNIGSDDRSGRSSESADEFEQRIFDGEPGNNALNAILHQIDKVGKGGSSFNARMNKWSGLGSLESLEDSFSSLLDGKEGKLKKAATYFEFDEKEIMKEDYSFRPDMNFRSGTTYNTKDLDLTKLRASKVSRRQGFEVTTKEVLSKADFRNVEFLANFITEAGIIVKRSQTGISAKAQRKVAREIKTARAFGLLPFTTMGTKSFQFGRTMEDLDKDYEYEMYDGPFVTGYNGKDAL